MINFDPFEFLQKAKRLRIFDESFSSSDGFDYNLKESKPCFVASKLLSDDEVNATVSDGFQQANEDFSLFSEFLIAILYADKTNNCSRSQATNGSF